jgi:hypothetical protein
MKLTMSWRSQSLGLYYGSKAFGNCKAGVGIFASFSAVHLGTREYHRATWGHLYQYKQGLSRDYAGAVLGTRKSGLWRWQADADLAELKQAPRVVDS